MAGACIGLLIGLAAGCDVRRGAPPPQADAVSTAATPSGFDSDDPADICRALTQGDNPYFGRRQVDELRRRLAEVPDSGAASAAASRGLRSELAWHLLRLGRAEEAIAEYAAALAAARADPAAKPEVDARLMDLAVAHLRLGETQNCIERHCCSSCIFPLDAQAVHERAEPSRTAAGLLTEFLSRGPHPPSAQFTAIWLLNLAHMTLGTWPDGVPEAHRLRPELFRDSANLRPFEDAAPRLGVATFNLSGGAVMDDFDNDGRLDLVCSTMDPCGPLAFHRNDGSGGFSERTKAAGLENVLGGLNLVHADYDNDGWLDLLVLRGAWLADDGRQRVTLLRNLGGARFEDATQRAGLGDLCQPTQSAAWGDYDVDGDLDLCVAGETGAPLAYVGRIETRGHYHNRLFRNSGDGTFADVTGDAGVANERFCKAVVWGDYDNDGRPDLYVSNLGQPNRLYHNEGAGRFRDVAAEAGVEQPLHSFPAWFFDCDNDGWLDLFVGAYQGDVGMLCAEYAGFGDKVVADRMKLYRNRGDGRFEDVTRQAGLHRLAFAMGANFGDVDNDGWLDFYLGTGFPSYEALVPNLLFRNDRGRRFADATAAAGLGHLQKGHGVAFGDVDGDGDQDIYHQLGGALPGDAYGNTLFLNPGQGGHWLTVRLVGTAANRFGVGARLRAAVREEGTLRVIHRCVGSGGSFGGSSFQEEIGLGAATAVEWLEIDWPGPGGGRQRVGPIEVDGVIELTEGQPQARRLRRAAEPSAAGG